jgi:hypothetical protein
MVRHLNSKPYEDRSIRWRPLLILILFLFLTDGVICAQPDLARKYVLDSFVAYRDARISDLFYYLPGDLKVATDNDGKPDFKLLLMRYTGTRTYDDQGTQRFRNLLQMRIIHSTYTSEELRAVREKLKAYVPDPELRAIPVKNLKAVLICSAAGPEGNQENTVAEQEGYFSQENDNTDRNEYWKERSFIIRLDNAAANILWDALQDQQTILSVGFAFYSDVFNSLKTDLSGYGSGAATDRLNEMIRTGNENAAADSLLDTRVIKAGAFEVIIDTEKWPDLITKVDINEQIPPDYAAVDVYCYDFHNNLRPDLAQKKVEVEAAGVGGDKVTLKYTFRSDAPDIYAYDMKFPYAVKIDVPYRFRLTEITKSGVVSRTEWTTRQSWNGILDITSKPDN